jgi:hypothetical protein
VSATSRLGEIRNLADSTRPIYTSAVQELATFVAMDGCEL